MQVFEWKPSDFDSFWAHYGVAQKWIKISNDSRKTAHDYYKSHANYNELLSSDFRVPHNFDGVPYSIAVSMNNLNTSLMEQSDCMHLQNNQVADMEISDEDADMGCDDEDEISPEYLEFVQKTEEHRKQRDEQRKQAVLEHNRASRHSGASKWLIEEDDDYVLASDVGVHGAKVSTLKAPIHRKEEDEYNQKMARLYGVNADRLKALDASIQCCFAENYQAHNHTLWPNIPLRFI